MNQDVKTGSEIMKSLRRRLLERSHYPPLTGAHSDSFALILAQVKSYSSYRS